MLKDNKLRGEIFQEFLNEEGLYKHKGFDVEDEDNQVFAEMDNMKIDIEEIIKENNMLKEDGIIVTKIDTIEEIYEGYEDIILSKSKKYGNTTVCYYKFEEN